MPVRDLVHAWVALVVLSLGTALVATAGLSGQAEMFAAAGVLVLAGLKARVILARYLGLACTRFWTRVFDFAIGMFLVVSFALYAFGTGG